MPANGSMQAIFGIINAVFHLRHHRLHLRATLHINHPKAYITGGLGMAEQHFARCGNNNLIMLSNQEIDLPQVCAVVINQTFLTIMNIQIFAIHMFPEHISVAKTLHSGVTDDLHIILIARHHQPNRVAWIGQ